MGKFQFKLYDCQNTFPSLTYGYFPKHLGPVNKEWLKISTRHLRYGAQTLRKIG